jgi:hypothetical protein
MWDRRTHITKQELSRTCRPRPTARASTHEDLVLLAVVFGFLGVLMNNDTDYQRLQNACLLLGVDSYILSCADDLSSVMRRSSFLSI